jgi:PAS domain S-box-containing protein
LYSESIPVFQKLNSNYKHTMNKSDKQDGGIELLNQVKSAGDILESRIHEKTMQLNEAQSIAHIGSWAWDVQNDVISWSDEMFRIYGFEPGSVPVDFKLYLSYVHPEDAERVSSIISGSLQSKTKFKFNHRIIRPDGIIRILQSRGRIYTDSDGEVIKMSGTGQDITEHTETERELHLAKKLSDCIISNSVIGIVTMDKKFCYTSWNEATEKLTGIKKEDAIGKTIFELYPEIKGSDLEKLLERVLEGEKVHISERPMFGGGFYEGHLVPLLDEKGEITGILNMINDISKLKVSEEKLRERERFIQKVSDVVPSLICVYNINTGEYLFINKAIQNFLGYSLQEALAGGMEFFLSITHPDDLIKIMAENQDALNAANTQPDFNDSQPLSFEYRMKHKQGHWIWVNTYGIIFDRDKDGKVEYLLNVSLDITERKKAEEILNSKNIELTRSNQELEQFAYVASHDLKEPLRMVSSYTQLIEKHFAEVMDEEGREFIQYAIEGAKRMGILINDLLDYSRIGRQPANFTPVDCNDILADVSANLEREIEAHNAKIILKNLPVIKAARTYLSQLFQNLIENALKFHGEEAPVIEIESKQLNGEWEFTVKDNGIGISPEYKDRIFVIFQRLHSRDKYAGTGIGLAICKKIVELHGGRIWIESTLGEGTSFHFTIPA